MQTHELNPTSAVAHLEIQPNGVGLELLAVSRLYGSRAALDRCRFRCEPGEFVAVVGKSGSGKSTLLRLLAGLERATSGQILQDGSPIDGINRSARVMFQEPRLLPWKRVEQNAALGLDANGKARAKELLVKVGLDGREGDWPTILSGGQKQRVALARALAGRPRLLLLDEPLGALDALNRYAMQDLIERLWLDLRPTALLVTHDPEEAILLGDRVIVLDEGKVVKDMVVDLPRPRDRDSSDLRAFRRELLDVLLS